MKVPLASSLQSGEHGAGGKRCPEGAQVPRQEGLIARLRAGAGHVGSASGRASHTPLGSRFVQKGSWGRVPVPFNASLQAGSKHSYSGKRTSLLASLFGHHSNVGVVVLRNVREPRLWQTKQDLFPALVNSTSFPQSAFRLEGMNLKRSSKARSNILTGFINFICLNKHWDPRALSFLKINKQPGCLTLALPCVGGVLPLKFLYRSQPKSFIGRHKGHRPQSTHLYEFLSSRVTQYFHSCFVSHLLSSRFKRFHVRINLCVTNIQRDKFARYLYNTNAVTY